MGDQLNSDETRYSFLAARSFGHSVPYLNGCEQKAGCSKLIRTILFDKNAGRLKVSDTFELEEPGLVESVIICEASALAGSPKTLPAGNTLQSGRESCPYKNHLGQHDQILRLRFSAPQAIESALEGIEVRMG